jgi:hypothetical protein
VLLQKRLPNFFSRLRNLSLELLSLFRDNGYFRSVKVVCLFIEVTVEARFWFLGWKLVLNLSRVVF